MALRFTKMHGLGNDFVVIDARQTPLALDAAAIRRLGDRRFGVGFDQLLTIETARDPDCAYAYGIWNTDGSRAGQCGNGLRCVVAWLARAGAIGSGRVRLESPSGPVEAEWLDSTGLVRADMGAPQFAPAAIPFVADAEAEVYPLDLDGTRLDIGAVSMGNPHAVLEVEDLTKAPVATLGPRIEQHSRFPAQCNVGFAKVRARDAIGLRVWERGVGETLACGSGACAAVAVLQRRGRLDARVQVTLPGGELRIERDADGHSIMTGPATFVCDGEWYGA